MANITKALVERVKAPQAGQLFVRDDELTGFALRITEGAKSFIWEGRIKGRVRRVTLGQYPGLTVLMARKLALEVKTAIANGGNPADARMQERREGTFGELAEAYISRYAKEHRKSWATDERRLRVHFGRWNTRKLSDLTREEAGRVQHLIAQRHGKVASNRAMTLLRSAFNWAAREGIHKGDNPAVGLTYYHEQKRERFLSPEELRRVNEALAQEPNEYWRAYFALALMLGTRKQELLSARWTDIDLGQQTIRLPETKAGRSHVLPLPAPAIEILRSLSSCGRSEWVFPSNGKSGRLADAKTAWRRIRKQAGVEDVTVHDLRRTLGSWLAAAGYNLPLIGRALNHSNLNSTTIYARLDLGAVRQALEANAAAMRLGQ